MRWATDSPMPMRAPQHSSMPWARTSAAGVGPFLPVVGRDHLGEEGAGRLDVVVVAVDPALGQAAGLVLGQDAGAHRHVEAGLLAHQRDQLEDPAHGPLVGAPERQHQAELGGARGPPSRGRPPGPPRCRGRGWPSPACRSATTASRSGSPRGNRRSWPTGSPPPPPSGRTTSAAPGGPGRPAAPPRRRAGRPGRPARRRRAVGGRRAGPARHAPAAGGAGPTAARRRRWPAVPGRVGELGQTAVGRARRTR